MLRDQDDRARESPQVPSKKEPFPTDPARTPEGPVLTTEAWLIAHRRGEEQRRHGHWSE